jgi:two-component system LytT family response regulator
MVTRSTIRVLIVDDEPGARRRLERLLGQATDIEIVGEVGNGHDAIAAIRALKPDLVFLDVQMPGMTGIEVVQAVGSRLMPATIFVTAYDQYAVKAFDLAALDYLLKPFDDERFEQALTRAREDLGRRTTSDLHERLDSLLHAVAGNAPIEATPARYLKRIAVEMQGKLRIVPVDKISFISARGNYVYLHVGQERLLVREQMQHLEERLPPDQFFRIHRSLIVRLDEIETLVSNPGGDYTVRLLDGRTLRASRSRWKELAERLGIQTSHMGPTPPERGSR